MHLDYAIAFVRTNADDARHPITLAAANASVDRDASTIPSGRYNFEGDARELPRSV